MREINSRADLEALRGTPDFEVALLGIYGAMTVWALDDGAWVAQENLGQITRLDYTKQQFLDEIAPFDFPAPVAPPLPEPSVPDPLSIWLPRREFRRALLHAGGMTTADVVAIIDALPDPVEREEMAIWWEDTAEFERYHPHLVAMTGAAGKNAQEADAIWIFGVGLLDAE